MWSIMWKNVSQKLTTNWSHSVQTTRAWVPLAASYGSLKILTQLAPVFSSVWSKSNRIWDFSTYNKRHVLLQENGWYYYKKMYFGIEDVQTSFFFQQVSGHINGWRLARVTCVLFEGKPQNTYMLVRNSIEHGLDDALSKTPLLIFVHINHLLPVSCYTGQIERFTNVDQIKNILLKAAASKSNRSLNWVKVTRATISSYCRSKTWRNLWPRRESSPTAFATSLTSAPVASHTADMALMLEMRWAKKALAAYIHRTE